MKFDKVFEVYFAFVNVAAFKQTEAFIFLVELIISLKAAFF
jgi:hypothetical protein